MKTTLLAASLLVLGASAVHAQNPPRQPMPADSGQMGRMGRMGQMGRMGPGDPARAEQLRAQIEQRFGSMVQSQLSLSEQQMDRVRQAMRANADRRRELGRREQDLQRAIAQQLQPGVAARDDSLNRMLDAVGQIRVQRAQSDQAFLRDLSFLTPVQRARLIMMMRRFDERVNQIRGQMGPMGQPGMAEPGGPGGVVRPRMQRPGGGPPPEFEQLDEMGSVDALFDG